MTRAQHLRTIVVGRSPEKMDAAIAVLEPHARDRALGDA
jgi:hypothetical protein